MIDFDVQKIRKQFPTLNQLVHGKPLVYLDNAATTQKPMAVIDAITNYYLHDNSNVHRGVHELSERSTKKYEGARGTIAKFIGASSPREIIFVRNATEGVNLVAQSYCRTNLVPGDEVLITAMEHHCNIVPWQMLAEQIGIRVVVAPINDRGELMMDEFKLLINDRTKFVSVTHMSNALGTINPIKDIIEMAHKAGACTLIDAAQSAYHTPINVQSLDCDFLVMSGHKLYGPTGIGVLFGKSNVLEKMPPYQGGGDMILSVTFDKTIYNDIPYRFEAGTPHIAGGIGLGSAVEWIESVGLTNIAAYEHSLLEYATQSLLSVPGLTMVGTAENKASILSFTLDGIHPHDIGTLLDDQGVAIRTGHHCAQPVMERFNIPATARASIACYNTTDDIDRLKDAVVKTMEVFS